MIKTLLFDADGVLIRTHMASRYFEEKYGIKHETTVAFYRGPFQECLLGEGDMYEVLPTYLKQWGWQKNPKDFVNEWFAYEHKIDEDLIADVQKLREQGIKCYVATNQERHRAQYMLEKMGFSDSFDGLFASAHLGSLKPDLTFFEKVLHNIGNVQKDTVLFWDDTPANVQAAKTFGIHAELYTDYEHFVQIMSQTYGLGSTNPLTGTVQ